MCFHLGMTSNYIWNCGTPHERVATEEEFDSIKKDLHSGFVRDRGKNSIFTQAMMRDRT